MYDNLLFEKKEHCNVFCFSFGETWFSDGLCFFVHQYQKILPALFLWGIDRNNGFSLKDSGGQLQSAAEALR